MVTHLDNGGFTLTVTHSVRVVVLIGYEANMSSNKNSNTGLKRSRNDTGNKVSVVLGAQWGDEGKGKVVDLLATESDIICRCQVRL